MYLQITDLIFDLYGTLVDIHTDENETVWEKTALYFGFYGAAYTGSELKAAFERAMRRREAQAGQSYECFPDIPVEQVMAQLFRDQRITENADTLGVNAAQLFRIAAIRYIRLYPHVRQALDALRGMGYRLWLLTNAQHVFTAYELRYLGLADAFSGVYISSDYGCRKPDGRFFNALLTEKNLNPANCLMIGNDRQTDIAGAKTAGMATLYLHTNLTPQAQEPARVMGGPMTPGGSDFEYEGCNWDELVRVIASLCPVGLPKGKVTL